MAYQMTFLFVSPQNAVSGQIAAALLNREDGKYFRGVTTNAMPTDAISPELIAAINELGIELHEITATTTEATLPPHVDRVIAIGKDAHHPSDFRVDEAWGIPDLSGESARSIVRKIHANIRRLVLSA